MSRERRIIRQTWMQYLVKRDMGLFYGCPGLKFRFHWKFWEPIDCIGGRVWFGRYVEHFDDEGY